MAKKQRLSDEEGRSQSTLSAIIVLGMLRRQPDTVSGVVARLNDSPMGIKVPSSTIRSAFARLVADGSIAILPGERGRPAGRLSPTPKGEQELLKWMYSLPDDSMATYDLTFARLEFCITTKDWEEMRRLLIVEEERCDRRHALAHGEVQAARDHRARRRRARHGRETSDQQESVQDALIVCRALYWGQRGDLAHRMLVVVEERLEQRECQGPAVDERTA